MNERKAERVKEPLNWMLLPALPEWLQMTSQVIWDCIEKLPPFQVFFLHVLPTLALLPSTEPHCPFSLELYLNLLTTGIKSNTSTKKSFQRMLHQHCLWENTNSHLKRVRESEYFLFWISLVLLEWMVYKIKLLLTGKA